MSDSSDLQLISSLLKKAQNASISKKKQVGCVVEAVAKDGRLSLFTGSNFAISESFAADHAEQMAVKNALLARCYPFRLHVTNSNGPPRFTCELCKEFLLNVNRDIEIVVHTNHIAKQKLSEVISDLPNDYKQDKNKEIKEMCHG